MPNLRASLVLLLSVLATAAPGLALAQAAAEGLLLDTLTASDARGRTRRDGSRRDRDSRALELANLSRAEAGVPLVDAASRSSRPSGSEARSGDPMTGSQAVAAAHLPEPRPSAAAFIPASSVLPLAMSVAVESDDSPRATSGSALLSCRFSGTCLFRSLAVRGPPAV